MAEGEEKRATGPKLPCVVCSAKSYPLYVVASNHGLCGECADRMAECPHSNVDRDQCSYCGCDMPLRAGRAAAVTAAAPTPSDRKALEHALEGLRELDSKELERVSTELTMAAAEMCQGGRPRDKMPDRAAARLMLARVAYVVAHEGTRG
jgi:hypothetical protein